MVTLTGVRVGDLGPWSFEIGEGERVAVVISSSWVREALVGALARCRTPSSGQILLFARDIFAIPEQEALRLFREVGIVWNTGGLISNLKIWQNILLPMAYHSGMVAEQIESRVVAYLARLGKGGDDLGTWLASLPGLLPPQERRLVGLVRALVMEPRLLVYDAVLDGLPPRQATAVFDLVTAFHAERPGRTSVFLVPEASAAARVKAERIIELQGD
jgi:phospholipid/cholesterol/gamma-HCH transport system ATP-binding protein